MFCDHSLLTGLDIAEAVGFVVGGVADQFSVVTGVWIFADA